MTGKQLKAIDYTTVILVSKVKQPSKAENSAYYKLLSKIVTKLPANRAEAISPGIISPNPSTFVPQRHTGDNTELAYDWLKHKKGSMSPRCALKYI